MQELYKRIKSGLWVAFAGFLITFIGLVLQNLDVLQLTPIEAMLVMSVGTAIISQITKYLNK